MLKKSTFTNPYLVTFLTFLTVALFRLYYIQRFAVAIPFWDQWDAEGDHLLSPFIKGTLKFPDLWTAHNEHRIFPTRLLSILIFKVTHEWNNLTEARVNAFLTASIPAILVGTLSLKKELYGARWLVVLVILAQFILPFPFENILVGFQSQFYFLLLFTVIAMLLAAFRPDRPVAQLTTILLSLLCIVTMASGMITPFIVSAIYLLRWWTTKGYSKFEYLLVIVLAAISVWGYLLIPVIGTTDLFRATNFSQFSSTVFLLASFPFRHDNWASILWLPGLVVIPVLFFRQKLSKTDLFMVGCFGWSLAQVLAVAYGRGQEMTIVPSRYTELFTLGLIANAWFILQLGKLIPQHTARYFSFAFFILIAIGHQNRYRFDKRAMKETLRRSERQVENVSAYLKTKNPKTLVHRHQFEIPYPDPVRLQTLLDDPVLRNILPIDLGPAKRKGTKKGTR